MLSVLANRHQYRIPANRDLIRLCESLNRRSGVRKDRSANRAITNVPEFLWLWWFFRLIAKQDPVAEAKSLFVRN